MPSSQLQKRTPRVELVCPAGTLPALRAAVDHGADAVYIGFRGETNARNFPGLNFTPKEARTGLDYAHARGARVFVALNVYPSPHSWPMSVAAVDCAAALGVDALILADPGLMAYAADRYPALRLHLSVQASATNWRAIEFYRREFSIHRAVLPRVLSCTQVARLIERTSVEIEVFGFGSLCVMVEGRCALSSYVTGQSPNTMASVRLRTPCAGRKQRRDVSPASTVCSLIATRLASLRAIRRCAKVAFASQIASFTQLRSPPASTRSTCCRL